MDSRSEMSRRRYLRCGVAASFVGLSGCASGSEPDRIVTPERPIQDVGGVQTQFRCDPGNTGRTVGSFPVGGLEKQWQLNEIWARVDFPFALVDGVLYGVTSKHDFAERGVRAVDVSDGSIHWEWAAPDSFLESRPRFATPAVTESTVLVADGGTTVYALDRETGDPKYKLTDAKRPSAPTVMNGLAAVGADNGVLVFDADSGEQVTLLSVDDSVVGGDRIPPAMNSDFLVTTAWNRDDDQTSVVAFQRGSWEMAWAVPIEDHVNQPVSVDDDVAVTVGSGGVNAVSLPDGTFKWRWPSDEWGSVRGPAIGREHVYVVEKKLWALSRETGSVVWKRGNRHGDAPRLTRDHVVSSRVFDRGDGSRIGDRVLDRNWIVGDGVLIRSDSSAHGISAFTGGR